MYFYTVKKFASFCDREKRTAEFIPPYLDVQDICQLGLDGLNEVCLDDVVSGGEMLSDIAYQANDVKDGKVSIKVFVADADEWLTAHRL